MNNNYELYDSYKWLTNVDDYEGTIQDLKRDINQLKESIQNYKGHESKKESFIIDSMETIEYLSNCMEILHSYMKDEE